MKLTIKKWTTLIFLGSFLLCSSQSATRPSSAATQVATQAADKPPSGDDVEFFEKKIRPVLVAECYMCHSADTKNVMGGLLLDTREGMLKGGASGTPAVVPGDPEKSLLIKAIRHTDSKLQMPLGKQLSAEQIKDFENWVKMGAPDPRKATTAAANSSAAWQPYDFTEVGKFWSFQPIKDSPLPLVKNQQWVKSPIDRFVLAKLEKKNLKPVADADKRTLIRRVTFDLIHWKLSFLVSLSLGLRCVGAI